MSQLHLYNSLTNKLEEFIPLDKNLVRMCQRIISLLEDLQTDDDLDEGMKSILGDVEALFLDKLALAKLA